MRFARKYLIFTNTVCFQFLVLMPSQINSPVILHLRDFIDSVGPDPSRPEQGFALQIEASLYLPFQTNLFSDDVELNELPTTIHFFASPGNPQSYEPNKFIYAWGPFLTSVDPNGALQLILRAHEVDCHPGDHSDSHIYNMHCPEAALPTVSLLGIVQSGGGQLNNGSTLLHCDLETNVYDPSNKASVTFTVSIYFRNGNLWTKFPVLSKQSRIFITGRIFGITTNTPRLAIGVDDVYFIPNLSTTAPVTPTSSVGKQKQADRWNSRANPATPTKRPRTLTSSSDTQPQDDDVQTCLSGEARLPIGSDLCDKHIDENTNVDQPTRLEDGSSADTILPGRQPKRSRRFSKADSPL